MANIHPSIINAIRRQEMGRDSERNIVPAQRRSRETYIPIEPETVSARAFGRIATLASAIGRPSKPNVTGEAGELS